MRIVSKQRQNTWPLAAAAAAALALLMASVSASGAILVQDPSFEAADAGSTTVAFPAGSPWRSDNQSSTDRIVDEGLTQIPDTPAGEQWAQIDGRDNEAIWQYVGTTDLESNWVLSALIGDRNSPFTLNDSYRIALYEDTNENQTLDITTSEVSLGTGDTLLGESIAPVQGLDFTFEQTSLLVQDVPAGTGMFVFLTGGATPGVATKILYDDVQLFVPEPAVAGLIGVGGLLLLSRRRGR